MYNACKLFGLTFGNLLNGKVSVGDDRLFKVNDTLSVTDQKRTIIQFVNELIHLRDGNLVLPAALTMSQLDLK